MHISTSSFATTWPAMLPHPSQHCRQTTLDHSPTSSHLVLSRRWKTLTMWPVAASWPFRLQHQNECGWLHSSSAWLSRSAKTAVSMYCNRQSPNNLSSSLFVYRRLALTNFRLVLRQHLLCSVKCYSVYQLPWGANGGFVPHPAIPGSVVGFI